MVEGIAFNRLSHGERLAKSQWCIRCLVRPECLAFAFETKSQHVIRGERRGMSDGSSCISRSKTA